VLPPSVEETIQSLADDHTSGASRIARIGLQAMAMLSMEAKGHPNAPDLKEAARRISQAQPAMAVVHNVVHMYAQLVAEGQEPRAVFDQIVQELDSARERIARSFLKVAPDHADIITTSFSDNVLATIQMAAGKGRVAHVYALESRPLLEGRFLVIALTEAGIPASLVPDAMGPSLMATATLGLVGADSILNDGSIVNKIGTYALALSAADHKKPFHVACETLKFDARYDASTWPGSPLMNPRELWDRPPEKIDVMNRYFEVTPGRLVTSIVTERGTFAPDIVRTMLAQAGRTPDRPGSH
jgi:translation initiation factor 2B subunit (eIF-2B alpha/beta/delta family)